MEADNKYFETGSSPYYLNLNNTAKNFSFNENTNPQNGVLDTLSKHIIIENEFEIQPVHIHQQLIIENEQ
jgi:hypothetical protein